MKRPVAWGDYASRLLACALLFGSSFALLAQSTFAFRMRNDVPLTVSGMDGVHSLAFVLALALALVPLVAGPAFLRALLVCGWIASGIGSYWWTTVPWDELITDSNFPAQGFDPSLMDYVLAAGPALIATLYVILARVSRVRKECKERGVDHDEATRAAAAAFLTGAAALACSLAFAGALWALLATGALRTAARAVPVGVPAILLAAALGGGAWILLSKRVRVPRVKANLPETAPPSRARRAES